MKSKINRTNIFISLCAIVYFVSYLTRNSFNSVIPELTESLSVSSDAIGFVGTCAFLTYGIGQIICGALGDKLSPRYMILAGIALTSVCNLLMPKASVSITQMSLLWGINGFAQAMFWPPLVRLMAEHLFVNDYNRAVVTVTTASSVGNILLYLASPLCVANVGWKPVFYIMGSIAAAVCAVWFIGTKKLPPKQNIQKEKDESPTEPSGSSKASVLKIISVSGVAFILVCIVLQGMLRDGLATWMPSLVSETYGLSNAVSILTAVILPVFAIIGIKLASLLDKKIKNELLSSAILYSVGLLCSLLLLMLFSASATASVSIMAVITAAMHGINLMLISRVPIHFARYGRISTVSGILNAFTYIGSAASAYGFAWLAQRFGWYFIIGSWVAITALGMLICFLIAKKWKKFIQ
jgi:OPA family glycerol-3-phosphate transporter-like MFS transporter